MAKIKTVALTLSGISALSGAAYTQAATHTPNQVGMAMMRLNSALLDQAKAQTFGSGSLWAALRKDFRIGEVNSELVRRHETKFAANSAYFDRTVTRSKPYMYHIAQEVKKRNMPAEIALLPFIESAFVTKAKSHVGASGLWQFMPATGRHYGLEKTALYDGRHDVYAATDAALNYLQYLHGLFGDWSLALAAYNWGEGNVGRAVNRARAQGIEPTYENLRMPNETRNYVPKLLAVRNIVSNPQSFGMHVSEISNRPYFETVNLDKPVDNTAIARLANISESEFLALNPAFNAPVFIPKHNRKLLLPADAVATFEKNYRKADPESLLSWDVYTTYANTSLSSIAAETGMSISEIKRLNGMSKNSVSAGRSILVAKNSLGNRNAPVNFIDNDDTPDTYRSNMPQMAPVQMAKTVDPLSAAQRVAAVIGQPQTVAAAPVDFVSQSQNAAVQPLELASRNQAVATGPSKAVAIETKPADMPSETAIASANSSAEIAAKPISLAAGLTQNANAAPQAPTQVAIAQPLPLPTQSHNATEELANDSLMALVEDSTTRLQAAEVVKQTLAQADDAEAADQARATRLAENRAKQQKRIETRLARANQAAPVTVAAGMHRVSDGDTLFNISRRYNLSVADLVTANNIKGNNIRKGQLLRVAAVPSKTRPGSIRNVSYTVRKGDTLNTIANRFHVDVNDIRRWNRNTRSITPGQRLNLMGS